MIQTEVRGKPLRNGASAFLEYHRRFGKDITKDLPSPKVKPDGEVQSEPIPVSTILKLYEVFRISAEPELKRKLPGDIMDEEIDIADAEVMAEVTTEVCRLLSERSSQKN